MHVAHSCRLSGRSPRVAVSVCCSGVAMVAMKTMKSMKSMKRTASDMTPADELAAVAAVKSMKAMKAKTDPILEFEKTIAAMEDSRVTLLTIRQSHIVHIIYRSCA